MPSVFQQFKTLRDRHPYLPSNLRVFKGFENINCPYCDEIGTSADCHVCFTSSELTRSAYCSYMLKSNECLDCDNGTEMQLCYGCTDNCEKCYACTYCVESKNCMRCHFCDNCFNLSDCFGCVELENKQFYIFNKQYSETEYRTLVAELAKLSAEEIQKRVMKLRNKIPRVNLAEFENDASDLCSQSFFNTRCHDLMYSRENEDCAHLFEGVHCKDTVGGNLVYQMQAAYETVGCDSISHSAFMIDCSRTHFSYFCNYCADCAYCFGCVGLEFKEYYIFNKPYKEEEYYSRVKEILETLNKSKLDLVSEWYRIWSLEVAKAEPIENVLPPRPRAKKLIARKE